MQTINLDISAKSIIPLLYAKQGDVGRKFKAVLTNGGVPYSVPAGAAVSVWYSGTAGEGNYTDIGADSAVSVSGNEITVELITQMLANHGAGSVCIVINTGDGDQLGTWNIPYMVEALPGMGSAAAEAYFTAFSKAVQDIPYFTDHTLSTAGKAADAAAVGEALAKKAPAGFGLGEEPRKTEDLDTAFDNGWYHFDEEAILRPDYIRYGTVFVKRKNYLEIVQEVVGTNGVRAQRFSLNGAWDEWEYFNPPMTPGVEYRTTERWYGWPVYTKLIDCGQRANGATVYIADNADDRAKMKLIRYDGSNGLLSNPIGDRSRSQVYYSDIRIDMHNQKFVLYTDDNEQGYGRTDTVEHWFVQMWYIKKYRAAEVWPWKE